MGLLKYIKIACHLILLQKISYFCHNACMSFLVAFWTRQVLHDVPPQMGGLGLFRKFDPQQYPAQMAISSLAHDMHLQIVCEKSRSYHGWMFLLERAVTEVAVGSPDEFAVRTPRCPMSTGAWDVEDTYDDDAYLSRTSWWERQLQAAGSTR